MPSFKDITGKKFGRLLAIKRSENMNGRTAWLCICDCGKTKKVASNNLINGHTRSCGCIALEKVSNLARTHGLRHTREYESWAGMKARCFNKNNAAYKNYGGRGITVCSEWVNSFETFLKDMGNCEEGMSIDRIDVNGNYSKENCRWATRIVQQRNKRTNRRILYKGRESTISEIAEFFEVRPTSLCSWINNHGDESVGKYFETRSKLVFYGRVMDWRCVCI